MFKTDYELALSRPEGVGPREEQRWQILQAVLDYDGFGGPREAGTPVRPRCPGSGRSEHAREYSVELFGGLRGFA